MASRCLLVRLVNLTQESLGAGGTPVFWFLSLSLRLAINGSSFLLQLCADTCRCEERTQRGDLFLLPTKSAKHCTKIKTHSVNCSEWSLWISSFCVIKGVWFIHSRRATGGGVPPTPDYRAFLSIFIWITRCTVIPNGCFHLTGFAAFRMIENSRWYVELIPTYYVFYYSTVIWFSLKAFP